MAVVVLTLFRLASLALGIVALIRIANLPDDRWRHGTRSRVFWIVVVLAGGIGGLFQFGPLAALWRTRKQPPLPPSAGQPPRVPPIDIADGVPVDDGSRR